MSEERDLQSSKDSAAAAALSVGEMGSDTPSTPVPSRRRSYIVAWAIAAVSVVLIAVSAWGLISSGYFSLNNDESISLSVLNENDNTDAVSNASSDETSEENTDEVADSQDDASENKAAESDDSSSQESSSGESSSDASNNASSGSTSSASAKSSSTSGTSSTQSSKSSSGSSATSSGTSSQGASSQGESAISVHVTVDSSNVGSTVSYSGTVRLTSSSDIDNDGELTVFDALAATGLSIGSINSSFGSVYISSIGGLAEGSGQRGWKYFVDGYESSYGCDQYVLQGGESIVWKYVLSASEGL